MLKITVSRDEERTIFALAGRLAGPWVEELRRCWQSGNAPEAPSVRFPLVDLQETTFIDEEGRRLLRDMRRRGVELKARGCLMRAIVEELAGSAPPCTGDDRTWPVDSSGGPVDRGP
jgi:hypothetical protein